ncbi:hypothetical protein IAU60_000884 [Kwoniella sp. DSM 27419]
MRFTSPTSRPSLTPMGYRLLHISETKLSDLDGFEFDEGKALWKGVVVREAVRSAWKSVEEGSVVEMNDWSARGAMGLDVVSEEDEDEDEDEFDEGREQQWFENLVTTFGEDETYLEDDAEHEWIESAVSMPDFDDLEYDADAVVAFTFPLPVSPTSPATGLPSMSITIDSIPTVSVTDVEVVEVDDDLPVYETAAGLIERSEALMSVSNHLHITPVISPLHSPISPLTLNASLSPPLIDRPEPELDDTLELEEMDWFALPPPLIRSLSYSTTSSGCDEDEPCRTPPLRHAELDQVSPGLEKWLSEEVNRVRRSIAVDEYVYG